MTAPDQIADPPFFPCTKAVVHTWAMDDQLHAPKQAQYFHNMTSPPSERAQPLVSQREHGHLQTRRYTAVTNPRVKKVAFSGCWVI